MKPAGLNIEKHYKEALKIDPSNPYAHAYWGHLIIWERKDSKEAVKHFAQAVSSHRSLSYVREIQLAALHNFTYTEMDYLRAVNDMVKNHEKINADANRNVFTIYYLALNNRTFDEVIAAVPPKEQIEMFHSLFYNEDFDPSRIPTRGCFPCNASGSSRLKIRSSQNMAFSSYQPLSSLKLYLTRKYINQTPLPTLRANPSA